MSSSTPGVENEGEVVQMECTDIQLLYRSSLEGKITPQQEARIREHISDCADCFVLNWEGRGIFMGDYHEQPRNNPALEPDKRVFG